MYRGSSEGKSPDGTTMYSRHQRSLRSRLRIGTHTEAWLSHDQMLEEFSRATTTLSILLIIPYDLLVLRQAALTHNLVMQYATSSVLFLY